MHSEVADTAPALEIRERMGDGQSRFIGLGDASKVTFTSRNDDGTRR